MTHGTTAHYRRGCRCDPCRSANTRYDQYRRLDLIRGLERTVDATGTRRRIQALHCLGWTLATIADECGWESQQAVHAAAKRARVTQSTAARIADVYERLSETPGPSNPSRIRAEKRGYAPPLAWWGADIDDPAERPDPGYREARSHTDLDPVVVDRILAGDISLAASATKAERVAVVARWRADGRSLNELERLTGWEPRRYVKGRAA